ncbi:hypothetical protein E2K98_09205 [Bacillus salipaludis]|uniref:Uncharacterized protein n=1 Tax=Bacillus salipaludis TaxID=2547811 RepID=A0A4R5VTB3_9BACI|nr:hypothetical protein [Bacillus salipaludis]MDQ6600328.1 hypothetical protein [Bacillus salipaludis]TDK62227.1 hypothetical protein E2K98_09205 [Bacillus salipaludis]
MKAKWMFMIILVIVFSGGRMAMADEGNQKMPSTSSLNGNELSEHNIEGMDVSGEHTADSHDMEGMDMSGEHTTDSHDMEGMDMSGEYNTENHDMEGMDMEGSGHSHGTVIEKPANLMVLDTYGAVNLSFIVIGIWNKWFRRKDGSNGNSK